VQGRLSGLAQAAFIWPEMVMSREHSCQCRAYRATGATLLLCLAAGLAPGPLLSLLPCLRVSEAKAQGSKTQGPKTQAPTAQGSAARGAGAPLPQSSPLPPRRPAEFGSQSSSPAESQPAAGSTGAAAPTTDDTQPDVLLDREAIRSCGAQWQKMKMDGSASGKSWREFSRDCGSRGPAQR